MTQIEMRVGCEIASSTLELRRNFAGEFSHRFALESQSERVMDNAVENRIRQSWVSNLLMPLIDRDLSRK